MVQHIAYLFNIKNIYFFKVSHPAKPGNEQDWMANNLNEMNGVQNGELTHIV